VTPNPFFIFGVLAMGFAATIVKHEGRAKALALTGFMWVVLGMLVGRG
jgi:hypothetical protein